MRPFLDHNGPIAIAHRGGALAYPENSMAAFQHAVDLGYGWVETDVHVTSDGALVAFHDEVLDRVTNLTGAIAERTWAELSEARIADQHKIPLFSDLLATFPSLRIAVDPKSNGAVEPLIRTLQKHNAIERVCVGSFSDERIRRAREVLGPALCTGLGPREIPRLIAASMGSPAGVLIGDVAQVPPTYKGVPLVTRRFVAEAHRRNLQVHVWTINDPNEMARLLDLGVDAIMTDDPALLLEVMGRA